MGISYDFLFRYKNIKKLLMFRFALKGTREGVQMGLERLGTS